MKREYCCFMPVGRQAACVLACCAVFACTLVFSSSVYAFEQRFYGGAAIGLSILEPDPADTGYALRENASSGFEVRVGWDFNPRWSFEFHYAELGAATLEQQQGLSLTPPTGEIDYTALGLSGIAYFYNAGGADGLIARTGLSLFAGLGLGQLSVESGLPFEQNESQHISVTGGAEYGFRNGFAARLQISGYDKDAMAVHAGLLYRFGDSGSPHVRQLTKKNKPPEETAVAAAEPAASAIPLQELQTTELAAALPESPISTIEIAPTADSFNDGNDGNGDSSSSNSIAKAGATSDADADGVFDHLDGCPGSTVGQPVDEIGCAVFEGRLKGLTFEPESADLGSSSRTVLDELATQLLLYPEIRLAIMAHTDNSGRADKNLEISKHRAATVARYLVRRGVSRSRLRAEAYGESIPAASNKSAAGRVFNRRIELRVW